MFIPLTDLAVFAFAALVMVLSPGPNMIYLVSRALCQGTAAGMVSLVGVALGFVLHMLLAACGLTTFFLAVPVAYDALKIAGALYLLWLAWQAVRPGARSVFETRNLPQDSVPRLISMGFVTNALNPKIAIFYVSIFSQFLDPERGSVFAQSVTLGVTQITISVVVNSMLIVSAAGLASWFRERPTWSLVQRWFMGSVLSGLAVKLALDERK